VFSSSPLKEYRPLRWVLVSLTFETGMVDAVTYLGLGHVFAANMTGNVVLLGFALAGNHEVSVSGSLVALSSFLAGAALGGRLARALEHRGHGWILTALGLETALVATALDCAVFRAVVTDLVIVGVLALAIGMRGATVRMTGIPDLTTTVLTMTLTGLAAEGRFRGDAARRRLAAVVAMLLGAATGALLLRDGMPLTLAAMVALLLLTTAGYLASVRSHKG
jgi:uncharacterized membrane protein YoaK (UPF0700 family)